MAERIEFVRNYNDLCTNKGYQFEFFCDRCNSGFRTPFRASVTGTVTSLLEAANGIFGGVFGKAADVGERVRSVAWEKGHDSAFRDAVGDLKGDFVQCPRCSLWVCKKGCWNTKKGLCKECAPDLGVEMSAAQSSKSVEEIWAHAAMAEEDKKLATENWRETIRASCPECGKPMEANLKFCPECGAALKKKTHCTECGGLLQPGAKFCGGCGKKVEEAAKDNGKE